MAPAERRVEWLLAAGFAAACAAMLAAYPPGGIDLPLTLSLLAAFVLLCRGEYHVGVIYTTPTQLVFIPMLLLLPPALVPLMVAAGYLIAELPDQLRGRAHSERAVVNLGDSWYAVGPALVLAVAGTGDPAWSEWPLYLAALGAQFAFDTAASLLRERSGRGLRVREQLPGLGRVYAFDALLAPVGLLAAFAAAEQSFAFLLVLPFALIFAVFTRERDAHIVEALELSRAYKGTARLLADVLERSDGYTAGHSRDVVSMSVAVAQELGLDAEAQQEVEFTALLHDIGKLAMPAELIEKPGALSPEEWELMKTHTIEGERLLVQVGGLLGLVGRSVRASHERWDGTGYPDGLAGTQIPLPARIVACCDALDAMTSDRSYRAGVPVAAAVAELRAGAGTQFDPGVAAAAAVVAERRMASEPARPDAEEIAAVAEATRELSKTTDPEAARRAICSAAVSLTAADSAAVLDPDEDGAAADPEAAAAFLAGAGTAHVHFEPLRINGALLGVLAVASGRWADAASPRERRRLGLLACDAAVALERTDLVARLRAAARTDELTGLLKRGAWEEELRRELARSVRDGRSLCVAMLDLDHFKQYNDAHGHPTGDEALRECAVAWRGELRLSDHLGRYGGDEFMVLLPACDLDAADQLIGRLTLSTPLGLGCSAGIAAWDGVESPAELIERADAALLEAKHSGRPRVATAV